MHTHVKFFFNRFSFSLYLFQFYLKQHKCKETSCEYVHAGMRLDGRNDLKLILTVPHIKLNHMRYTKETWKLGQESREALLWFVYGVLFVLTAFVLHRSGVRVWNDIRVSK